MKSARGSTLGRYAGLLKSPASRSTSAATVSISRAKSASSSSNCRTVNTTSAPFGRDTTRSFRDHRSMRSRVARPF